MFLVILGDIHIDNLQNIFPYATMNITSIILINPNFWLGDNRLIYATY